MLRLRREADVASIAVASTDPESQRWLDDEPLTPDQLRTSVSRAEERWRSGLGAPFVIADAETDAPLGLLNVDLTDDEIASLAVSVFPAARGRGVGSKALRLGALWGLRDLGLQRIVAEADVDNAASVQAITKAGFHREGRLRMHCKTHGTRHDCVMFSLIAADVDL